MHLKSTHHRPAGQPLPAQMPPRFFRGRNGAAAMTRGIRPVRLPRVSALVAVARVSAAVLFVLFAALPATAQPSAPQGFAASNGNAQVKLTWDAPAEDADIARHEYRFKTTGDYPAAWTAIEESAPGGLHEDWVVVTGLTNDVAYTFQLRTVNAGGDVSTAADAGPATPRSGVCGRTEQVRDAIVAAIAGVSDCADVTTAELADVTVLDLRRTGFKSLQPGDFSGMAALTTLDLGGFNYLSSLPDGVFSDLTALEWLDLGSNELTSLPAGVFSGLTALEQLLISNNELTSLPAGVFSGLTALTRLELHNNGRPAAADRDAGEEPGCRRDPRGGADRGAVRGAAERERGERRPRGRGGHDHGPDRCTGERVGRRDPHGRHDRGGDRGHRPDHPAEPAHQQRRLRLRQVRERPAADGRARDRSGLVHDHDGG